VPCIYENALLPVDVPDNGRADDAGRGELRIAFVTVAGRRSRVVEAFAR